MSANVKAHGLDGELVNPDWPALTLGEVDRLLRRYPQARKAERILSYSPRPFSAASVVESHRSKVFVKRHHRSIRDRDALLEEHRWLEYLSKREALVKGPMEDWAGETAVTMGEWSYEVYRLGAGIDLYENAQSWTPFLSVGQARHAGRALAKLHAASAGYAAPARQARTLVTSFRIFAQDNPWPSLASYVEERPALQGYLEKRDWEREAEETFGPLHERLRRHLPGLRPLWTHNDFHASNLFWSNASENAEVTGIFDMGLADRTNAVHDVATAIERNGVRWLEIATAPGDPFEAEQIEALLGGYAERKPFSREEAEAVVAMLPLVHAEFALSETDYFLRLLKSEEKADAAYIGYFLGHARWFRSDAGKRLLERLQNWAEAQPVAPEGKPTLAAGLST